jgi:hypothetical protein
MHRWIIGACAALLLTAIAPVAQANPLMPVQPPAATAAGDNAVTEVHYRPWRHRYYRHYGWYRGRHYGWYRPHRHYWHRHYGWYGPRVHLHWRYY